MPRSVWLLMVVASLAMCSAPLLILVGGILGHELSPSESLKTLPIALFVVGAAFAVYPAVRSMGRFGRKAVFLIACGLMFVGALAAAASITQHWFWGVCTAGFILGTAQSIFAQIRFAAMELVAPPQGALAASRIMLSGLCAAILGPELIRFGAPLVPTQFVGAFVLLAVLAIVAAALLFWGYQNHFPPAKKTAGSVSAATYWGNSLFWLALISAAVAYGIMSLIMTATPLTMYVHQAYDLEQTKAVIQGHIVAMFLPSFASGWLIRTFGERAMIFTGLLIFLAVIGIAFYNVTLLSFAVALAMLGIGWNFMFVAATALLPKATGGSDPYRVQALNDLVVVVCQACATLLAGWLLNLWGWQTLLLACLPAIGVCFVLLAWVKLMPRTVAIIE